MTRRGRCSAATGMEHPAREDPPRRSVDSSVAAGEGSALGVVEEVIYVGDATRFVVGLDAGGVLVVVQQNLSTTSTDVHDYRGRRVRLIWRDENEFPVRGGTASSTAVADVRRPWSSERR